jgi:hypothetical protein
VALAPSAVLDDSVPMVSVALLETASLDCNAGLVGASAAVTSVCDVDSLGVVDGPGSSVTMETVAEVVISVVESVFGMITGSKVEVRPGVEVVCDVIGSRDALLETDTTGDIVSGLAVALVVDSVDVVGELLDVFELCVLVASGVVRDDVGGLGTTIITVVVVVSVGGDVVEVEDGETESEVDIEKEAVVVVVVGVSVDVVKVEVVVSVDVVVGVNVVLVTVKFVVVVVGVSVVVVRLVVLFVVVILLVVVNVVVIFVEMEVVVLVVNEVVVVFKLDVEVIVEVVVELIVDVVEDCVVVLVVTGFVGSGRVLFQQAASEKK